MRSITCLLTLTLLFTSSVLGGTPSADKILIEYAATRAHDKGNCDTSKKTGDTTCIFANPPAELAASGLTVYRKKSTVPGPVWRAQVDGAKLPLASYVGTQRIRKLGVGGAQTFYRVEDGPLAKAVAMEMKDNSGTIFVISTERYAASDGGMLKWLLK